MYGYYLLASLGVNVWWKRYLTQMQMTQFFLMMCQGIANLYIGCKTYPKAILQLMVWYMLSFLILFANFYRQNYNDPKKDKRENGSKNIKPSSDKVNGSDKKRE